MAASEKSPLRPERHGTPQRERTNRGIREIRGKLPAAWFAFRVFGVLRSLPLAINPNILFFSGAAGAHFRLRAQPPQRNRPCSTAAAPLKNKWDTGRVLL